MLSRTKLGLWVLFILGTLIFFSHFLGSRFHIPEQAIPNSFVFDFNSRNLKQSDELQKIVQKDLQNQKGSFAVYIEDLQDHERYQFNELELFPAASLYKLVLMAAVFQQIEQGKLTLDQQTTSNKFHLSQILGSEDFGYEEMPDQITFTVEEALTRMGTISDNYAAIMLTEKVKANVRSDNKNSDPLTEMAEKLGLRTTNFGDGETLITTTAYDIGRLFKSLADGQVVSKEASDKILEVLSKSKINNRIPAELPKDLKISHKTGELSRIRHDAGIVYLPDRSYVIVLMSKDLQYEDDGVEVLGKISKDVYDYFNGK
jgi:beta-lactamase class A